MSAISRILLPVDFSPRGVGAARYAAALAQHYKAELTVLHVIQPFVWGLPPAVDDCGRLQLELMRDAEERRKRQLDAYSPPDFRGLTVKRVMLIGDAADLIVRQAEFDKTDLIVMPTRGCGPFRRFLLGSVTAKVLHDATCPIWTGVHLEETSDVQWKVIRNVACAVDTGSEAPQVLKWAADFANEFGARLTIVHAIPAVTPLTHGFFDPDLWNALAAEAREKMAGFKLEAGVQHADILVEKGSPSKAVSKAATQIDADLLVIGRNPMDGVLGRLLEHAYSIIRESPCPVVSV
jgi:nucleotide-binding universal stress UspA family protein